MRAVRVRAPGGLDALELGEQDVGPVSASEIRVGLHASSLNFHDYLVATGVIPVPDGRIPMSDGAGEVLEVGADVERLAVGDNVVGLFYPRWVGGRLDATSSAVLPGDRVDGYAREQVVAPASAFVRSPAGWSHAEAATLPCAAVTAWRALFVETTVLPGQTVLVQGSGGVSVFALQLSKAAGARVVATTSSEEKVQRLHELGADAVVNYRHDPDWGRAVKSVNGGHGVDHVVQIGSDLRQSLTACGAGAHIALVGALGESDRGIPFVQMISKNVRITGFSVGSRADHLALTRALETTGIRPVVDATFPLEGIADAFRYQESARHLGKIVLAW